MSLQAYWSIKRFASMSSLRLNLPCLSLEEDFGILCFKNSYKTICYLLLIIKYVENILCSFNLLSLITRRRDRWHSVDKSLNSSCENDNYVSGGDRMAFTENYKIK